jgi:hypothetical protein
MAIDQNSFIKRFFIFPALLGFSLLLCSLALATSSDQINNDEGRWVSINDEGVIDAPIWAVMDHLKDVNKADSVIPGLLAKKILKQISETERIDYDHYEVPWPFSDRYTIYRARTKNTAGREIFITMKSLDNYPFEDNDKVLARVKKSSFLLQSLPENESKTKVRINLMIDPGGYLPNWLVEFVAGSWAEDFFGNLRRHIKKEMV